jgi:hypothetical protein
VKKLKHGGYLTLDSLCTCRKYRRVEHEEEVAVPPIFKSAALWGKPLNSP